MQSELVLLRYDLTRKAWVRAGHPMLFSGGAAESEAHAKGLRRCVARRGLE
jgi:hypothetical protein